MVTRFRLLSTAFLLILSLLVHPSLSFFAKSDVYASATDNLQKTSVPYKIQSPAGESAKPVDAARLAWCEDKVARTLAILPKEHVQAIHSLTLSFDPTIRRGLAGGNTLIIRCVNISEKELAAVLVHEVGHVVDTGLLHASSSDKKTSFADRGQTVYSTDPSVRLYSVSWEDNRSFTGQSQDVVSGYSLSNPYEEFAETYVLYVLHGRLFKFYAGNNSALARKYRFMKTTVFDGTVYDLGREPLPKANEVNRREYDVTRLDFNLESFWALKSSSDS